MLENKKEGFLYESTPGTSTKKIVKVKEVIFGGDNFVLIAGPCAVESEEQMLRIAKKVKSMGAHVLRGGAFKPRTSPYSFQGLGEEGLKALKKASTLTGLPTVTEAIDVNVLDIVAEYADIIQIGARNMQNFSLLKEAGKQKKPLLLKRGPSATIEEWLMAAEYILSQGNENLILCERGIRSFDEHTRNTLDLSSILAVRNLSQLPVIVDPSHATGRREMVVPLSLAAKVIGASGAMVEVHDRPDEALCDGKQSISPLEFSSLHEQIMRYEKVENTTLM